MFKNDTNLSMLDRNGQRTCNRIPEFQDSGSGHSDIRVYDKDGKLKQVLKVSEEIQKSLERKNLIFCKS